MRWNNKLSYLVLIGIVILFWFLATLQYCSMEEDAFISFRYAESFAHGNGMYFNGDYGSPEWVAGFSNFLWVLILSILVKFGVSILAGSRILLLIIGAINIFLLYFLTCKITKQIRPINILPSILLTGNVSYQWYATGGLETSLFICVVLGALLAFINEEERHSRFPLSAILFGLLAMIRPEAPFYFVAALVWRSVKRWREEKVYKEDAIWLLTFIIIYLSFLLFSMIWFRDPFPSSFNSKAFGRPGKYFAGISYLLSFFTESRGYLFFLPVIALLIGKKWDKLASTKWLLALFVLAGILFVLASGGDGKIHYRFIITFIPFAFIIVTCGIMQIMDWFSNKRIRLYLGLGVSLGIIYINSVLFTSFAPQGNLLLANIYEMSKNNKFFLTKLTSSFEYASQSPSARIGLWMKANLDPDSYLATGQAGQIPYYARLKCLDLGGLNDYVLRNIRREYNWGFNTYVLARRPDYIGDYDVMIEHYGENTSPVRLVDDPDFIANYRLYRIFDSKLLVAGKSIGSIRFFLFKRESIPKLKPNWHLEQAIDDYIKCNGEVINYEMDYVIVSNDG